MTREDVFNRIAAIEREHRVAQLGIARLHLQASTDPAILDAAELAPRDIAASDANLARTYVVRLYAEFEAALRGYWTSPRGLRRRTEPPARALMDGVIARRKVDARTAQNAHAVREYRNNLVHGGARPGTLTLGRCRSFLHRFVSYLPIEW